jgi:hypothetical protein
LKATDSLLIGHSDSRRIQILLFDKYSDALIGSANLNENSALNHSKKLRIHQLSSEFELEAIVRLRTQDGDWMSLESFSMVRAAAHENNYKS